MGAQERANRILAAWVEGNSDRLRLEVEGALLQPRSKASYSPLENEEQELLESVVLDLWGSILRSRAVSNDQLQSNFVLLEHLSHRMRASPLEARCLS